jgi:hypothetical protein
MWIETERQRQAYHYGIAGWTVSGIFAGLLIAVGVLIAVWDAKDIYRNEIAAAAGAVLGGTAAGLLAAHYGKRYRRVVTTSWLIPQGIALASFVFSLVRLFS